LEIVLFVVCAGVSAISFGLAFTERSSRAGMPVVRRLLIGVALLAGIVSLTFLLLTVLLGLSLHHSRL